MPQRRQLTNDTKRRECYLLSQLTPTNISREPVKCMEPLTFDSTAGLGLNTSQIFLDITLVFE